jgi:hypothetical protein
MRMLTLHKDGDRMGISTRFTQRASLIQAFSLLIAAMIDRSMFSNDWEYQLAKWITSMMILCDQMENTLEEIESFGPEIGAGSYYLEDPSPTAYLDDKGEVFLYGKEANEE